MRAKSLKNGTFMYEIWPKLNIQTLDKFDFHKRTMEISQIGIYFTL